MEPLIITSTEVAAGEAALISVILCTRNRADFLEKALISLIGQDFPQSEYEIIVVDNGSTDRTADVTQQFQSMAAVRYIHEDRVGLCIARNTGWQAAKGKFVAYFDDDAIAHSGWLRAIRDTFEQTDAGTIGVAGGPVDPIWQAPRPPWLPDEVASSLTIIDWGPSEKIIENIDLEWLVGTNMALPKSVLEEVDGFHPWLDRVGGNLLSSGDVFLQKEIFRRGYKCLYVPAMAIKHLVPVSRLNQDWFLRRFYWQGVSDAVMHLIERSPSPVGRIRIAFDRTNKLMRNRRRMKSLLSSTKSPDVFALKCFALLDIGFILGLLGAARR